MDDFGLQGHPRPRVSVEFVDRFDFHDPTHLRVGLVVERQLQDGLCREITSAVHRLAVREGNAWVIFAHFGIFTYSSSRM